MKKLKHVSFCFGSFSILILNCCVRRWKSNWKLIDRLTLHHFPAIYFWKEKKKNEKKTKNKRRTEGGNQTVEMWKLLLLLLLMLLLMLLLSVPNAPPSTLGFDGYFRFHFRSPHTSGAGGVNQEKNTTFKKTNGSWRKWNRECIRPRAGYPDRCDMLPTLLSPIDSRHFRSIHIFSQLLMKFSFSFLFVCWLVGLFICLFVGSFGRGEKKIKRKWTDFRIGISMDNDVQICVTFSSLSGLYSPFQTETIGINTRILEVAFVHSFCRLS